MLFVTSRWPRGAGIRRQLVVGLSRSSSAMSVAESNTVRWFSHTRYKLFVPYYFPYYSARRRGHEHPEPVARSMSSCRGFGAQMVVSHAGPEYIVCSSSLCRGFCAQLVVGHTGRNSQSSCRRRPRGNCAQLVVGHAGPESVVCLSSSWPLFA